MSEEPATDTIETSADTVALSHGAEVARMHGRANLTFMAHLVAICFLALPSIAGIALAWAGHRTAAHSLTWAGRLITWSRAFFLVDLAFYLVVLVAGVRLAVHHLPDL